MFAKANCRETIVIFVVLAYYFLHIMVVCVCLSFIVYLLWFAALWRMKIYI